MGTRYLTGSTSPWVEAIAFERGIGLMVQPRNPCVGKINRYPFWAADNGAFTRSARGFDPEAFRKMLERPELLDNAASCLFVVAPDELEVLQNGTVIGDARGTLAAYPTWARLIRSSGFPAALVAQDGLETMLDEIPWDIVDALFIGGSTEWKLSPAARACVVEARRHGKRTHMGRVNSYARLARASAMLCDTADGTFLMFAPEGNVDRLVRWLDKLKAGVQSAMPWGR